jgi:predicted GIY-YIG superfamily endonuclease
MPKKDGKPKAKPSGERWFVYMVRCADGSLYAGIAKDVIRRCQQHNAGTASRYTRSRLPVELVYQQSLASRSLALKREAAIKAISRREKLALIRLRTMAG